jgi:hypothetical protein
MDPVFVDKLKAASAEAGIALPLTSGFRSQEKQDQLRAAAVKKYGSEEAASKWVAKTSIHTTGNAADFSMDGDAKKFWDNNPKLVAAMEKQGLHRPLAHESWHWESDITKGQDRKGLAAKLIAQRNASLAAGTQPPTGQSSAAPTLAQTAQGVATGVSGMLAAQGVPGTAAVTGAVANPPKGKAFLGWAQESVKNEFIKRGYSPEQSAVFAKGAAAQLVQETGWDAGSKQVGQNNFFNIKETSKIKGDVEGKRAYDKAEKSNDVYAGYSTPEKGIAGYVDFLINNPRYTEAGVFKAKTPEEYAQALQKAGFATDPDYAKKITSIMGGKKLEESLNAYKGDTSPSIPAGTPETAPQVAPAPTTPPAPALAAASVAVAPPAPTSKPAVSPAQITPVPASAAASENRKKVSEMLGIPADALPVAGEQMAWFLNQQNAIPEKYKNNPRQTPGERQRTTGPAAARRQNSSSQEDLRGLYAKETFTGSVPPPAKIPSTMPLPPELSTAPARTQQNYQLLGQPNVQATIDTLQAGGANLLNNLESTAARLGVSTLPDPVGTGISIVDQLRTNGAFGPMMSGDLSGVLSKTAPSLKSFPGLQYVFNQSASGGGEFARQFNSVTGDALKGTGRPNALGAAGGLGGVAGGALRALGGTASNMLSGSLSPQSQETSGPLESAGFADKQNERDAMTPPAQSVASPTSNASKVSPERGSTMMKGDEAPLEIRNSESSIRRLTDMLIAFSFG